MSIRITPLCPANVKDIPFSTVRLEKDDPRNDSTFSVTQQQAQPLCRSNRIAASLSDYETRPLCRTSDPAPSPSLYKERASLSLYSEPTSLSLQPHHCISVTPQRADLSVAPATQRHLGLSTKDIPLRHSQEDDVISFSAMGTYPFCHTHRRNPAERKSTAPVIYL